MALNNFKYLGAAITPQRGPLNQKQNPKKSKAIINADINFAKNGGFFYPFLICKL